ncbi:unannotated protein [freshwater metagenome]|uniref:Unannotated protein n=1 Tax=freshwater metagenome TaxID=449393 RepID=A0A6J7SJW8_9ZZZZ
MTTTVPARKRPLLGWNISDGAVVARFSLVQTLRVPELMFFSLVQPVIFVLLFAYVFGGAIPIAGTGASAEDAAHIYRNYLMPGIFGQTVAFAAVQSTVGIAEAMSTGLIDRFRSLPMASGAVLIGRTFADALRQVLVLLVLSITGLLVGWRITGGFWNAVGAYLLLLLFAYAVSWVGAAIGLVMPNVETASTAGLIWLFPLTFLSNAFVPLSSMPTWLQPIAAYNPVSTLVLATRELFGNPTGIQPNFWPLNNPVMYTIGSCVLIIAIFATLSIRRYTKTTAK